MSSSPIGLPAPPDDLATLVELLEFRARESPDEVAFRFLEDGEAESDSLTYSELDEASSRLAIHLLQNFAPGERILICLPIGLRYVEAFFGCLKASLIAVPAVAPEAERLERTLTHIQAVVREAGAASVITDQGSSEAFDRLLGPGQLADLKILCREDAADVPLAPDFPRVRSDDIAYLLFTSGSTGRPKGVVVSHGNVLDNLKGFPGWRQRPPLGFVSWLPYNFDLGLFFTLLHPIYRGVLSVTMPPIAFLKKPSRWLHALSKYQASVTTGPNFAYDLAVKYTTDEEREQLDLSCFNVALSGGERVRGKTLERFAKSFATCGFRPEGLYPSYGMTEATATISGPDSIETPRILTVSRRALERGVVEPVPADTTDAERLVGNGVILAGDTVAKIVDAETRREKECGEIGEVWLHGASVTQGYWRLEQESEEAFRAHLRSGEGPFFRTGDLAFFDPDGHLFPVGRLSDLIILKGVNYYPEVLEPTLGTAHESLRPGFSIAVSIDIDDEERLILVQEVLSRRALEPDAIFRAVRSAMDVHHGLDPYRIVLVPRGTLDKTPSGKFKRRETRRSLMAGELEILAEWSSDSGHVPPKDAASRLEGQEAAGFFSRDNLDRVAEIENWLVNFLRHHGTEEDIDPRRPIADYGMASIELVTMIGELGEWLGTFLAPTLAWDYPTPEVLARHIASEVQVASRSTLRTQPSRPIAIIGMACRLPGAADLDSFWQLLSEGRDAIEEIPPERWDLNAFYSPDSAAAGKMTTRFIGYLPDIERFDADFFNITPREADHVDPRQRLVLELSYRAFEHAGLRMEDLRSRRIGVYMAVLRDEYHSLMTSDLARLDGFSGAGIQNTIIANRLSYFFDLQGPSLVIDTACSGSLVAVHQACQALACRECEMALVGGVNLNQMPDGNIFFSKAGALAADGRCKTFDHRADGIVRSEGAGVVVLKDLERALADGDPIQAVIRGSAVNQDGHSNGLMAPNGAAQEALLADAWQRAGIAPGSLQYVEAHGTGTILGDPIEVNALAAALAESGTIPDTKIRLGSLKTNIGHTEAASGVAGLIKTVLAMQQRELPPSLHFEAPNPLIPFDQLALEVQTERTPWPRPDEPLIAGVSGFGFGGTNAHVVLEEAPRQETQRLDDARSQLLVLSTRTQEARRELAAAYGQLLATLDGGGRDAPTFAEVCATSALRRTAFEHRLAVAAPSAKDAADRIRSWMDGAQGEVATSQRAAIKRPKLAFVFSGQGSHWVRMGQETIEEPIFRRVLERCDGAIRALSGWSILDELRAPAESSKLDQAEVTQPAIFSIQVALANLWLSWGVEPDAVIGQSLGEVAAAHVAGVLSLDEAVKIVVHRGRLMARPEARGKTGLIGAPLEETRELISEYRQHVDVAGSSSPHSTVVSGEAGAMKALFTELEKGTLFARLLQGVDVAFHCPSMDPLVPELVEVLEGLEPREAAVPLYLSVDGELADGRRLGPDYWGRNLRQPFLFSVAIEKLMRRRFQLFLEISPHPVLADPIRQIFEHGGGRPCTVLHSLRRPGPDSEADERRDLLSSLGALFSMGQRINWHSVFPRTGRRAQLPSYPWQKQRFWFDQIETKTSVPSPAFAGLAPATTREKSGSHPLLGRASTSAVAPYSSFWELDIDRSSLSYFEDHKVQGVVVIAGAVHLEMARAAASSHGSDRIELREIHFSDPLVLLNLSKRRAQISLTPEGIGHWSCKTASRRLDEPDDFWTAHLSAQIVALGDDNQPARDSVDIQGLLFELEESVATRQHYQQMREMGLQYGATFSCIRQIWRRPGEALAQLALPKELAESATVYGLHPGLLDSAFQTMAQAGGGEVAESGAMLPVSIERLRVDRPCSPRLWAHCKVRSFEADEAHRTADIQLYDEHGEQLGDIVGLRLEPLLSADENRRSAADLLYQITWTAAPEVDVKASQSRPDDGESQEATDGKVATWLIFENRDEIGAHLGDCLTARGDRVVHIVPERKFSKDGDTWHIDPGQFDHYDRLLTEAVDDRVAPLRGLIHFWSFETPPVANTEAADLGRGGEMLTGVFLLIQALFRFKQRRAMQVLDREDWGWDPRLWLITRGSLGPWADEAGACDLASPFAATLAGLARALLLEDPETLGAVVDITRGLKPSAAASQILSEILGGTEDLIAVGEKGSFLPRIEAVPNEAMPKVSGQQLAPRADGSYLVTGGLGGLGLAIARRLAENGARRLILLGRNTLPPRKQWRALAASDPSSTKVDAVREIEALGTHVQVAAVDVADQEALADFLDTYETESWPPILGVVHAAGVVEDRLIVRTKAEDIETVLRPKIHGAWNLHEHFPEVDFFVLCSSVAASLGSFGQASYAAGNAFMDALARYRHARGMAGLSIGWGSWSEVGMAARGALSQQHARGGMQSLPTSLGLELLQRAMGSEAPHLLAVDIDWASWFRATARPPKISSTFADRIAHQGHLAGESDHFGARQHILDAPSLEDRQQRIAEHLRQIVAGVMRIDATRVHMERPTNELGIDSIMMAEIKQQIDASLRTNLSIMQLLSAPSFETVAHGLLERLDEADGTRQHSEDSAAEPAAIPNPVGKDSWRPSSTDLR